MVIHFKYPPGATPNDLDEAIGLIPKHISTQAKLNAWEEINIVEGADWLARQNILHKLDEGLVRELHLRMFKKTWLWAGTFRKSTKSIGIDWTQIAVTLKNLLDNTAYQIKNKVMPIDELVVHFHHKLVLIHAFPNGNGRHARLIADALIVKLGGKRFSWGGNNSIATLGITSQNYLSALRAADNGDIAPLMHFARK